MNRRWTALVARNGCRHENEGSVDNPEKLSAPVNMKNRNIVDYLKVCHSVWTVRHECLAPPTTWSDGRLTERSFFADLENLGKSQKNPSRPDYFDRSYLPKEIATKLIIFKILASPDHSEQN